jgi:hypothetical protein
VAPDGGHIIHAGAVFEPAPPLAPEDPPEPGPPDEVVAAEALDRAGAPPVPEPTPKDVPPVAEPEVAVKDAAPVAGNCTAPEGVARLVPLPIGCPAVCAAAGNASSPKISNARGSGWAIGSRFLQRFRRTAQLCYAQPQPSWTAGRKEEI